MKPESSAATWLKFFTAAGINVEYAEHYAVTFSKNQIQLDMLPEINKDYLNDMGINLLGHVIAILRHAKMVYAEEVKKTELPSMKAPVSKVTKGVKDAKPPPVKTSKTPKTNESYEKPSSSVLKRKSTVVPLPKSESSEPKPKVMKKLCDSSDDITQPIAKPAPITRTNQEVPPNDEARKGVFKRLGVEVQSPVDVESSSQSNTNNVNGVFSRLGEKADSVPQIVKVAAKPITVSNFSSSKQINKSPEVTKPLVKKSIIRTRLDKPVVQLANKVQRTLPLTYMDRELLKTEGRQTSKAVNTKSALSAVPDNRDIKSRLGLPSSKMVTSQGSGIAKKVSFGPVSQKIIPKVNELTSVDSQKFSSQPYISKFASNRPSGVFSRLGTVPY